MSKFLILVFASLIALVGCHTVLNLSEFTLTEGLVATSEMEQAAKSWTYSESFDEMTDELSLFAISSDVYPTRKMSSPYDDVYASIIIRKDKSREDVFLWFSSEPNLTGGEIGSGYTNYVLDVKWDESLESMSFYQAWGGDMLFTLRDIYVLRKMVYSETMLLAVPWYGQGIVIFRFSTLGILPVMKELKNRWEARKKESKQ